MSCIYAIFNLIDDKCYVGQTLDELKRWAEHRKALRGFYHHNIYLQRAWNKYGENNFIFIILQKVLTNELTEFEQLWIDKLKPEYNIAPVAGSLLGYKHTDEAKINMSKAHIGNKHSEITKLKMSLAKKGNKFNLGRKQSIEVIEHRAKFHRSKITSEETKAKMSMAQKGRTFTLEHRKKLSEAARNRSQVS